MQLSAAPASKPASLWRETVNFFAEHWGAIASILLPPTLTAYAIAIFLQQQVRALARHLLPENTLANIHRLGTFGFERLMLPVTLLELLKQWSLSICYCFAAVGVCAFVARTSQNGNHDRLNAFAAIREHPTRFLNAATLFFGILIIGFVVMFIISNGLVNIAVRARLDVPSWGFMLTVFIIFAFVAAVLVRWIFAVPLATLRGLSFWNALKLSDRITDNRAFALWALVVESEVSGYYAWHLPWWALRRLIWEPTTFSYWATYGTALLLAAMSQAPLMIAVGLVMTSCEASDISVPNCPAKPVSEIT